MRRTFFICRQSSSTWRPELTDIERENKVSGDVKRATLQVSLSDLKKSSATRKDLEWRKALEVRDKLKEYSKWLSLISRSRRLAADRYVHEDNALMQFSQLQAMRKPKAEYAKTLRGWLDRPEGGDFFLRGREAEIWEDEVYLITMDKTVTEDDSLTHLISGKFIPWYHYRWGHRVEMRHAPNTGI